MTLPPGPSGADRPQVGSVSSRAQALLSDLSLGLRYAADAELTLRAVTQGEGLLLLLRNTPQALADQPWILAPIERAVAGAACYSGARGEASEAAETLEVILRGGAEFGGGGHGLGGEWKMKNGKWRM